MKYQTKQRTVILETLRMVTSHPSADELYLLVKPELPKIGIATVYRNLERLSQKGLIHKLNGEVSRYDGNTTRHFHFRCTQCERVFDFEMDGLAESFAGLTEKSTACGLKVKVEFAKVCVNCTAKKGISQ